MRSTSEILGFDPLYVVYEGRFVALVLADRQEFALKTLRPFCSDACQNGSVVQGPPEFLILKTAIVGQRALDLLSGEALPRTC